MENSGMSDYDAYRAIYGKSLADCVPHYEPDVICEKAFEKLAA